MSINSSLSLSLSRARALSLPPSQRVSENLQRDDRVEVVHPQRVEGGGRGRGRGGGGGGRRKEEGGCVCILPVCIHKQVWRQRPTRQFSGVLEGGRASERASERDQFSGGLEGGRARLRKKGGVFIDKQLMNACRQVQHAVFA